MTERGRKLPDASTLAGSGVTDAFRRRQVPDVAGRFLREQRRQERQAHAMWVGILVTLFSDHELKLLNDLGYLSEFDRDLLRQAGRGLK